MASQAARAAAAAAAAGGAKEEPPVWYRLVRPSLECGRSGRLRRRDYAKAYRRRKKVCWVVGIARIGGLTRRRRRRRAAWTVDRGGSIQASNGEKENETA